MTRVRFVVGSDLDAPARVVWDTLVDWKAHEAWIPATRVEIEGDDPTAIGTVFTAWTGWGPLTLEDRMEVTVCSWSEETQRGECEVAKLGPVLGGRAGFTVEPHGTGARAEWVEDVTVRWLPGFLSPIANRIGALGFRFVLRRLRKALEAPSVGR